MTDIDFNIGDIVRLKSDLLGEFKMVVGLPPAGKPKYESLLYAYWLSKNGELQHAWFSPDVVVSVYK